jgi:hypothetical protein
LELHTLLLLGLEVQGLLQLLLMEQMVQIHHLEVLLLLLEVEAGHLIPLGLQAVVAVLEVGVKLILLEVLGQ